ncbi:MAG: PIN domain nuclease [Gammaproteobacteria bacterium]|nr:PIN domain nuclease [Gammaproteobacteria bacterium]NNE05367.1 PIN domain nuclease [Xanthomonadales bacterium]
MIFVDSSVWIDYFNGRDTAPVSTLDRMLGNEPLLVGDIVLAEVLQGFRRDKDFRVARSLLTSFPVARVLNEHVAIQSARNFRALRKKGLTVRKTVDSIIATFCMINDHVLLHDDRDFDAFEAALGLTTARYL